MGLEFTDQQHTVSEGVILVALDGKKRVIVLTSAEALEDYGFGDVYECADAKYRDGDIDLDGRVRVFTTDIQTRL